LDVAALVITGKNLTYFRFSEIEQSIPIGTVIIALLPYFLILSFLSKLQFWLSHCFAHVFHRPGEEWWREILDEPRFISISDVREYALRNNEEVLYQFCACQ
jgi:hypothetical protein